MPPTTDAAPALIRTLREILAPAIGGGYQRPGPGRAPAPEQGDTGGGYGGGGDDIPFASCSPDADPMMRGMATA